MYIRQPSLFSFEELLKYEPETRLSKILNTLDLTIFCKGFSRRQSRGPKGHDKVAMFRALIGKLIYGISNNVKLVERLNSDLRFRYDCGFDIIKRPPSESTFSRFFAQIAEDEVLQKFFDQLVKDCLKSEMIKTTNLAIDSSEIDAYEKTVPKSKCPDDGKHANWGAKRDSKGNQITWFGYKIHACVDADSELPIAITVTPASNHDSTETIPLLDKTTKIAPKPDYVMLDMGYDQKDIYEYIHHKLQAQAIIPLNKRGEKLPPEGLDTNRTPVCSLGFKMVYWGCDKKNGTLKFRCPHVLGKVNCPLGSNWCSNSNYGCVVKKNIKEDLRNFCIPHRDTKNWKNLYDKRTSVERLFARLKEHLSANNLKVRGIKKVTTHLLLCCITLILGTIAINAVNTKVA